MLLARTAQQDAEENVVLEQAAVVEEARRKEAAMRKAAAQPARPGGAQFHFCEICLSLYIRRPSASQGGSIPGELAVMSMDARPIPGCRSRASSSATAREVHELSTSSRLSDDMVRSTQVSLASASQQPPLQPAQQAGRSGPPSPGCTCVAPSRARWASSSSRA